MVADTVKNLASHRKFFPFINALLKLLSTVIHPTRRLRRHSWPFTEKGNISISKTFAAYELSRRLKIFLRHTLISKKFT